jgi:hypothetical protein
MDPAPRAFDELPRDREGRRVPFACGTGEDGQVSAAALDKRRVTQCALSRVCGVCGAGLGRPVVFLGTPDEVGRNAFHFPPSHLGCAERILEEYAGADGVLGQDESVSGWSVVTTGGFEFVRAGSADVDKRPVFSPNSILGERRVGAS